MERALIGEEQFTCYLGNYVADVASLLYITCISVKELIREGQRQAGSEDQRCQWRVYSPNVRSESFEAKPPRRERRMGLSPVAAFFRF